MFKLTPLDIFWFCEEFLFFAVFFRNAHCTGHNALKVQFQEKKGNFTAYAASDTNFFALKSPSKKLERSKMKQLVEL